MSNGTEVTIAIPTLNGEEFLDDLLTAVYSQQTKKSYEVLIIDSGSSDKTLEIIKRFSKVRLHQIPNSEFGHGKTRNLAVKMAEGEFVIFLTQDAVPSHDKWLDYMVEPFLLAESVSCILGKQIPRSDCFATLKREVHDVFRSFGTDDGVVLYRKTQLSSGQVIANTFLSDVNSAVRKSTALKIPFRDINYAEDQGLGIDMLDAGYTKAYAPLGSVFHSHNYPLRKYFRRKFDECLGLRKNTGQTMNADLKELFIGSGKSTLKDWIFIGRDKDYNASKKVHDFFYAPFYNFAYRVAIRAAANQRVSEKYQNKFSLEKRHRSKAKS